MFNKGGAKNRNVCESKMSKKFHPDADNVRHLKQSPTYRVQVIEPSNALSDNDHMIGVLNSKLTRLTHCFEKIADTGHAVADTFVAAKKKERFYKQRYFWSLLVFLSGCMGLIMTWQQQIKVMRVNEIKGEINKLVSEKRNEVTSIVKSRVVLLNSALNCPIKNRSELIKIKKNINNSLVNVIYNGSPLTTSRTTIKARQMIKKVILEIYNLKPSELCNINTEKFDHHLLIEQRELEKYFDIRIRQKQIELQKVQNSFYF